MMYDIDKLFQKRREKAASNVSPGKREAKQRLQK